MLITNFHVPKSTLMLLVSAFAGYEHIMALYKAAVQEKYRFFSYGDSMLLTRRPATPNLADLQDSLQDCGAHLSVEPDLL